MQGKRCDKSLDRGIKYIKWTPPYMHDVPARGGKHTALTHGLESQHLVRAYRLEPSFTVRSIKGVNILKGLFPEPGKHCPTITASLSFGSSIVTNDRIGSTKPTVIAKAHIFTRLRRSWCVAEILDTWALVRQFSAVFHLLSFSKLITLGFVHYYFQALSRMPILRARALKPTTIHHAI